MNGYQEQKILKSVLNAKQEIGCKGRTWTMNKPKKNKRIKCACGCGNTIWEYDKWNKKRKYIWKHCKGQMLGKKHSKKTRRLMSKSNPRYWLGKQFSKEHKEKMGSGNRGKKLFFTKKWKRNIPKARKGYKITPEARENIRKGHLGISSWNKGLSKKTDKRMLKLANSIKKSMNKPEIIKKTKRTWFKKGDILEKSLAWKGGLSFEPYGVEFNKRLKTQIKKRDKHTCQFCGEKRKRIRHCVHHIDYNKRNNKPKNLITLCESCHQKTNFNREFWTAFFKKKMRKR